MPPLVLVILAGATHDTHLTSLRVRCRHSRHPHKPAERDDLHIDLHIVLGWVHLLDRRVLIGNANYVATATFLLAVR